MVIDMNRRLTDEELDALAQRFSSGRHPKVAAALAELKALRGWPSYHESTINGLMELAARPDLVREAGLAPGQPLADAVPYLIAELDSLRRHLEVDEMAASREVTDSARATNRRGRREATIRVRGLSRLARRLSGMYAFAASFTMGGDAEKFGLDPLTRWTVVGARSEAVAGGEVVTTFELMEAAQQAIAE